MISVVIVTYNSRDHIGACLQSLRSCGAEVVVVDNASKDGTADFVRQAFPHVKLIASARNMGFAAASNLGVRQTSGTSLLFLNPDVVCPEPLEALEQALDSAPGIVAVAPRVADAEGRTQVGFSVRRLPTPAALAFEILLLNRIFPNNPVNRKYRCLDFDYDHPSEVEQPAAACLLVRGAAFDACGGFDEAFFPLWFEDVDLCLRLRQRGGKIVYWPAVTVLHGGGHSVPSITFSERQVYWYRNLLYYVHKHYPRGIGVAIRAVLLCGMALRIVAELPGLAGIGNARGPSRAERLCAYLKAAKLSLHAWRKCGRFR